MVAHEFYWRDEPEKIHFIPERRGKPERVTPESVLDWGRKVVSDPPNLFGWTSKGCYLHAWSKGKVGIVYGFLVHVSGGVV